MRTPLIVALVLAESVAPANAIPAFARRYGLPCSSCHDPIPKLTAFGESFAARGFQLVEGDTTGVSSLGDPLLVVQQVLPLAVRFDAYVRGQGGTTVGSDFQTPTVMKLLSGGPLARNMTYYFYLLLSEDGETGPIEDAWVMFRRPLGLPADVTVGQFQVADPLWKRELRITLEDYAMLSQRIGTGAANLSYDRGVVIGTQPGSATFVTATLVNGNGIGPASAGDFDGDGFKTAAFAVAHQLGPMRLGLLGYFGHQRLVPEGSSAAVRNRTWMLGPALTLSRGPLEINAQWLLRSDTDPLFSGTRADSDTRGGFLEAHWWPGGRGRRTLLTGLYNVIETDVAGGDYETATVNLSWLHARNVRVAAEATWDFVRDEPRVALGVVTAF